MGLVFGTLHVFSSSEVLATLHTVSVSVLLLFWLLKMAFILKSYGPRIGKHTKVSNLLTKRYSASLNQTNKRRDPYQIVDPGA